MERIGIITLYYHNTNYGALLQAYALQRVLKNMGLEAKQISYDLKSGQKRSGSLKNSFRKFYNKTKRIKWETEYKKHVITLRKFEKTIPHTSKVTVKSIKRMNKYFDSFICGSDQIWNPIGWQPAFFLNFSDCGKKKISYSASIARDEMSSEEIDYLKKYLKGFTAVSVREEKSKEILENAGIVVARMPDPVFLISGSEWEKLAAPSLINESYIFAYFLGDDSEQKKKAINYAVQRGKRIIFLPYLNIENRSFDFEHKQFMKKHVTVQQFLSLILHADLILTDSFHGAAFSIIFKRPFFVIGRELNANSMNSRIDTLLNDFKIKDRFVRDFMSSDISDYDTRSICERITEYRETGKRFLCRSLGINEEKVEM